MEQRETKQIKNENLRNIKHIIIVMSGKGGVGKSTVTVNLAVRLGKMGHKVAILDADIHGPTIPKLLGIENRKIETREDRILPVSISPNLKVFSMGFLLDSSDRAVIWRGPIKMRVIKQFIENVEWGENDYMFIDLPPGTGDEPLTIAQQLPRGGAIVVTTPQEVSLLNVRKSINFAQMLNLPIIGVIENMSGFTCPHCSHHISIFKSGGGERIASEYKIPFLGSVPLDEGLVSSCDDGLFFGNGSSAECFDRIAKKIENSPPSEEGGFVHKLHSIPPRAEALGFPVKSVKKMI